MVSGYRSSKIEVAEPSDPWKAGMLPDTTGGFFLVLFNEDRTELDENGNPLYVWVAQHKNDKFKIVQEPAKTFLKTVIPTKGTGFYPVVGKTLSAIKRILRREGGKIKALRPIVVESAVNNVQILADRVVTFCQEALESKLQFPLDNAEKEENSVRATLIEGYNKLKFPPERALKQKVINKAMLNLGYLKKDGRTGVDPLS